MARTVGYMLTWTTYGTWLQGDERGYVKNGRILAGDKKLKNQCKKLLKQNEVKLKNNEKVIVRQTILNEAERIGLEIEALTVCNNHIHLVMRYYNEPIGQTVSRFKNIATSALKKHGRDGKIWTGSFDKRFCFSNEDLNQRIQYVKNHD